MTARQASWSSDGVTTHVAEPMGLNDGSTGQTVLKVGLVNKKGGCEHVPLPRAGKGTKGGARPLQWQIVCSSALKRNLF